MHFAPNNSCPCGFPGARLAPGQGYFYVSKEVAEFRSDCPSVKEVELKIQRMQHQMGAMIFMDQGVAAPILMCELGAKKRGLNLEVASADAKHWWKTGTVPIRATPMAGEEAPAEGSGCGSLVAIGLGVLGSIPLLLILILHWYFAEN
ncbi:MAG: hypothetical protein FJ303_26830 [Planctomycetes bacterium]|nr:hypothetical protein [Planctomycetota bacterium]